MINFCKLDLHKAILEKFNFDARNLKNLELLIESEAKYTFG